MCKFLKKFLTHSEYENYIEGEDVILPNVSICDDEPNKVHYNPYIPSQPNNEIWYISSDGNIVTPYSTTVFGANIVSNEYVDGKGIIKFDGDVTSVGYMAFASYVTSNLQKIMMPNSVTTIGGQALYYCDSLTEVKFSNSLTSIGFQAFYATSMTAVTIPASVTSIEYRAFSNCSDLEEFNYEGTMVQWDNVTLGADWNARTQFTVVHCSDGDSTRLS